MAEHLSPLTIYKASAGSGKTFTLAVEYIKLLIQDPQNYRYTLAVTFTNKATDEMKTRILGKLYGIAQGLEDSKDYLAKMAEAFPDLTETEIRKRADMALKLILHHYHYFRVETIDSFFQRILRNLARELGLTANLQVGLNDNEVKDEAVDNIIEDIQRDDDQLLGWLMDFINEKMEDGKSWNVIGGVKEFGREVNKDFYKEHQHELREIMDHPKFFENYKDKLFALRRKTDETMKAFAEEYQAIANQNNIEVSDISQGMKSAPGYFPKLAEGRYADNKICNTYIKNAIDDPTTLIRKTDLGSAKSQIIIEQVGPLLARAEEERKKAAITLLSVKLTLDNINELQLLGRIEAEIERINTANNQYPLSNTQKLLSNLIDHQDSPFIYEKIGGQLRYIMIDEFQDTSTVQWNNFKVLLDDCLAHNNGSLIVGDVKQSIYRWRSGDWKLLQGLTPESDKRIKVEVLGTNYRSKRNIIQFNNAFFRIGAKLTEDMAMEELKEINAPEELVEEARTIQLAYADTVQKVSPKRLADDEENAGSVMIKLLDKTDYNENTIQEVKKIIEDLLSKGTEPKDIAILVRRNEFIQTLANYFQQNPITVNGEEQMVSMVSDEAFRLDASLAVCTMINAMYLLAHPNDYLVMATLVKAYHKNILLEPDADDSRLYVNNDNLRSLLPQPMLDEWDHLLAMPLMDLAERLYQIFEIQRLEGQSSYVCAFFDQLSDFVQNHISGIDELLKEWENTIANKSISSDEANGIRLLTIHKSKGLEYDNVIIPYCDWPVEKNGEVLWVTPDEAPYNDLPVLPLKLYAKQLKGSVYAHDYLSEHLKNMVDNLNLLYVAFTRAGSNLYIIGKSEDSSFPSSLIGGVLEKMNSHVEKPETTNDKEMGRLIDLLPQFDYVVNEDKTVDFSFGTTCISEKKKKKESQNVFDPNEEGIRVAIRNYDSKGNFKQSNSSLEFITPDEELEKQEHRLAYIQTGNVLHNLFANIQTLEDVDKAIDQMEFDGILFDQTMSREDLRKIIETRINTPEVAEWFGPQWQVFNECNILYYDESSGLVINKRPDRVISNTEEMKVIDFKTGEENSKHHVQVREYMDLLRQMGNEKVSGYLWYILPNRIVKVED